MAYAYCNNKKRNYKMKGCLNEWQNGMWVTSTVSIYIDPLMYENDNKTNEYVDKGLITMRSTYIYNFIMSPMITISDTVKTGYNLHM
jgi:hypothetical protein